VSGAATIPSNNVWKCAAIRLIVAASKMSASYSQTQTNSSPSSVISSERSNFAAPPVASSTRTRSPDISNSGGAFCKAKRTWKSGV
jgi:hypothetical protein